ncbi:MAG: FAD-dependent oxidoreductase, partial [Actinomycetia bacterium]|nr:FAD-dependent oxidoreductase [Actinomycetes bacterium]
SAAHMLRKMEEDEIPDFTDLRVNVIGGGNVAMDVARTALRLGAKRVRIIYRRRERDMTARPYELELARAEGCRLHELIAPVGITVVDGHVVGLDVQPMMVGPLSGGRPMPIPLHRDPYHIPGEVLICAIGQTIDSAFFAEQGFPIGPMGRIMAAADGTIAGQPGVFCGGDCVTGPEAAIDAIAAGKAAAHNIDRYLGGDHQISLALDIPVALSNGHAYCARANMIEQLPINMPGNFRLTESGLKIEEANQESRRCLRCDHFGMGALRDGRCVSW